jgi:hypothetical protein
MGIYLDPEEVADVLLDDGWHKVDHGTFNIAPLTLIEWRAHPKRPGEDDRIDTETDVMGFLFVSDGYIYSGPLSALRAMREEG